MTTPAKPTIVEFATELLGLAVSEPQEALLRSIYGLALTTAQRDIWHVCTGRERYPGVAFPEATVIAGARAGKDSRIAAPAVAYEAIFGEHEQYLGRGDMAMIPLIAQNEHATQVAFGLIKDYIVGTKALRPMVEEGGEREREIRLRNRVRIRCFPSSAKGPRAWSIPAAVLDELAFYRIETSANADREIQTAVRRGMLTFPSRRLLKISTPYLQGGVLYQDFKDFWGQDSPDLLVWRAGTRYMNPSIAAEFLERERRLDPLNYAREYEAEFGIGAQGAIPPAWIEAAVMTDRQHVPPQSGRVYVGAVDPSGGGADAFTLSIVYAEDDRVVHDLLRGWAGSRSAKVNLQGVVQECASLCRLYGIGTVMGDRFAGDWVVQEFQRHGVYYQVSEMDKSAAYTELAALLAQGRVELLDHATLTAELKSLERRDLAGGKIRIDHPKGGHDDYANATALAVAAASRGLGWGDAPIPDWSITGPPRTSTGAPGMDWGASGPERWEW